MEGSGYDPSGTTGHSEAAFFIWEQERRQNGNAVAHWLRAEAEIKTEAALGPAEPLSEKTRIKSEHDINALSTC
jgi:Protein of unknown function (DUF2934)